ncbi:MAG: IclR family transcriptional regulator [Lautropia sp.]
MPGLPRNRRVAAAASPTPPADEIAEPAAADRQFVTALARGLQVLACFSSEAPELSGSELARLTGLPQPTIWRLCHTMLELGMLIRTGADRMRPGLPVLRLGYSALAGLDAVELARPHMQEMADRYRAACGLATRQGLHMVMIERCHGDNPLLTNLRRGSVFPIAISGLGWAYLAGVPVNEREAMLAELERDDSARWKTCRKAFLSAFSEYEERGFIVNAGMFHPDYHTVAVPIYDRHGRYHCSLNCGAPISTLPAPRLRKEVAPKLLALADVLKTVLD